MDVNIHCSVQPNHCSSVGFYWSVQWQTAGFINCGPLWIHRRMKHNKAVLMFLQRWVVSTCPSLEGITQRVLAFILRCDWGDYICFHQLTFDREATNPRGKFDYIFDTKCFFFSSVSADFYFYYFQNLQGEQTDVLKLPIFIIRFCFRDGSQSTKCFACNWF